MNWISLTVGLFALVYGLYSIYARLKFPEKFGKLEAMKKAYGTRIGNLIHIFNYTLIPIGFGIMMIFAGIWGVPIFGE
jgi:hypothetical protein